MALGYMKLWKLLIDRDMTRSDLHSMTGVFAATFAKMTKGERIASSIIDCTSLKCDVGDIMEVVPDKNTEGIQ
ncbi:MAG: helix-turn-helix transcriptional regulator [Kiritimatiellae bacterium]|nr:helix-turn-helix transcriptional regulator [Kiritimatiellia bacterium]